MTRNIKALGLAIVAVAAMSMAVAASAQATQVHITSPKAAVITGQQIEQHTFATQAGQVKCASASFEGTVEATGQQQITTEDLTITPTYTNCEAFGLAAQVVMNGCEYTVTGKSTAGQTLQTTAFVDVICTTSPKPIEVIAAGGLCVATVAPQNNISHIVFTNTQQGTDPHHTHANITAQGIVYQLDGAFCPGGAGTKTDGKYHGQATFRAFEKTGQNLVQEHGHQFQKQLHNGVQFGMLAK